jgi:hypothetical protein
MSNAEGWPHAETRLALFGHIDRGVMDTTGRQPTYRLALPSGRLGTPPMPETELERQRHRALVAESLAAALTEGARRVSAYLPRCC